MSIDTKKLRELAEAATHQPDRFAWSHYSPNCDNHCDCYERAEAHAKRRHAEPFHAAANPQTVIALLDEIELLRGYSDAALTQQLAAANAEIERLRTEVVKLGTVVPQEAIDAINMGAVSEALTLREQLAAMTKARDEACDIACSWCGDGTTDTDLIAELRKVGQ